MNLTLSLLMHATLLVAADDSYATAYHKTEETGRPLVVLVGADWCPGCRSMKEAVIPELRKQGELDKVNFAMVNTDRDHELASKLMQGGSIPQLVIYRKTDSGWTRQQLTGAHSTGEVQSFLTKGDDNSPVQVSRRN